MATWTRAELDRIGQAEELHLAARRQDGKFSRYVTMWVVRASDSLYVRSAYDQYGPQIVGSVTGPKAHAVTIRLAKADQHDLKEGNKP